MPKSVLDDHIAAIPKGQIVTGVFPPDRVVLALSAVQNGTFTELLGNDDSLFPARQLQKVKDGQKVPFLFAYHGTEDSAVPCQETNQFVSSQAAKLGEERVIAKFEPGDHGVDDACALSTPWLQEGLVGVTKAWLD